MACRCGKWAWHVSTCLRSPILWVQAGLASATSTVWGPVPAHLIGRGPAPGGHPEAGGGGAGWPARQTHR